MIWSVFNKSHFHHHFHGTVWRRYHFQSWRLSKLKPFIITYQSRSIRNSLHISIAYVGVWKYTQTFSWMKWKKENCVLFGNLRQKLALFIEHNSCESPSNWYYKKRKSSWFYSSFNLQNLMNSVNNFHNLTIFSVTQVNYKLMSWILSIKHCSVNYIVLLQSFHFVYKHKVYKMK